MTDFTFVKAVIMKLFTRYFENKVSSLKIPIKFTNILSMKKQNHK